MPPSHDGGTTSGNVGRELKIKLSVLGYEVAVLVLEGISDIDNAIVSRTPVTKGIKKMSKWWTREMTR